MPQKFGNQSSGKRHEIKVTFYSKTYDSLFEINFLTGGFVGVDPKESGVRFSTK